MRNFDLSEPFKCIYNAEKHFDIDPGRLGHRVARNELFDSSNTMSTSSVLTSNISFGNESIRTGSLDPRS